MSYNIEKLFTNLLSGGRKSISACGCAATDKYLRQHTA